jgi:two-component system phosphate regulon response regulator PhoB
LLVVEDERDIREVIAYNLRKEATGEAALQYLSGAQALAILLDVMLPGVDGMQICRELRASVRSANVPIILITARGEEADIVAGLEAGADDYITKPFGPRVLVARVGAVLRRAALASPGPQEVVELGDLAIDVARNEVRHGGERLPLTQAEFRLLHHLARRKGWVFTRGQLVAALHEGPVDVTERSIDVLVSGLRKKLGAAGEIIETIRGVGYRLAT